MVIASQVPKIEVFVISCNVRLHIAGKKQITLLGEIKEGSSFVEVALVHNVKRTATVICKGIQ